MHPLFRRAKDIALYAAASAVAGVLLAAALQLLTPRPWADALAFAVPAAVLCGFVMLSSWWVCRSNPLTRGAQTIMAQLAAALQASAVWTGVSAVLAVLLWRGAQLGVDRPAILRDLVALFVAGVPLYLLSSIVHYLLLAFEASHAAERRALESQVSAREAELRALRAQLNPHFLFNSLNSINALVGTDPENARRMCERLGDFLRRTLSLGARETVSLGEELTLVDRYLDIEQVRFGDRLRVEREVDPSVLRCHVPPLLLQPLVENAIKHGVQDAVEGGTVCLGARREGPLLVLTVENPLDPEATTRPGEGVGLANVRRRLAAFGAREARLVAGANGQSFRVTLELPALSGEEGGTDG